MKTKEFLTDQQIVELAEASDIRTDLWTMGSGSLVYSNRCNGIPRADFTNFVRAVEAAATEQLQRRADAYKWAYEYLQERMHSIDRHGWATDCDGEIAARIDAAKVAA